MRDLSPADEHARLEAPATDNLADSLADSLADLLLACDGDLLARRLGLRSAEAAEALRSNAAAFDRLVSNMQALPGDAETKLTAAQSLLEGRAS